MHNIFIIIKSAVQFAVIDRYLVEVKILPSFIFNSKREIEKMSAEAAPRGFNQDLKSGPFSVLYNSVKNNTQVLVNLRNNHKILGRVKAYDRHMNLLLEDVKELWTEYSRGGKNKSKKGTPVNKDRYVSKMFLRGDGVILVVSNPAALSG